MSTAKAGGLILASAVAGAMIAGCGADPVNSTSAKPAPYERMAPCSSAPHCVSSLAADSDHQVEPLRFSGSRAGAHARLLKLLHALPRTQVVANEPDYVHAEVTSALVRFTDDLEFEFASGPGGGIIQVRSSSRVGYYDFGVNRSRIEALRTAFESGKTGG